MRGLVAILTLALLVGPESRASTTLRTSQHRDAEGYAIAACLTYQKSPFLKDQGDGWASNIVQREAFEFRPYGRIADAVKAALTRTPMAMIIVENPPMTQMFLPIQYCAEIIDVPAVRRAVDAAIWTTVQHMHHFHKTQK